MQFVVHSSQPCHCSHLLLPTLTSSNGFWCEDCSHVRAHGSYGHGRPSKQSQCVLHEPILQAYQSERRCGRGESHCGRPSRQCSRNTHICSAKHTQEGGRRHLQLSTGGDRSGIPWSGCGPRGGSDRVHFAIVVALDPWKIRPWRWIVFINFFHDQILK